MKKLIATLALISILIIPSVAGAVDIPEGATVKTADNPDVYIIKYKGGKQFKRVILNPQVFESYGHLSWDKILTVDQATLDLYATSDLVTVYGEKDVYQLIPDGDNGSKFLVNYTAYDPNSVYTINEIDFRNYTLQKFAEFDNRITALENTVNQIQKTATPTPTPTIAPLIATPTPTPTPVPKKATVILEANTTTSGSYGSYPAVDITSKGYNSDQNRQAIQIFEPLPYTTDPLSFSIPRKTNLRILVNVNNSSDDNPAFSCNKSGNKYWAGQVIPKDHWEENVLSDYISLKKDYDSYIVSNPVATRMPLQFNVICTDSDGTVSSDYLIINILNSDIL